MKKYDIVLGAGCSFMNGDAIDNEMGKPMHVRPAMVLAKKLNCKEENLARTGSSNDRIFRNIFNWVESNSNPAFSPNFKNPLIIIGLSGTARYPVWNDFRKQWFDIQPANVGSYDDRGLSRVNENITDGYGNVKDLRFWQEYYIKWIYNSEKENEKLQRNVIMLHHYLKAKNVDYYLFNSLEDGLGDIKDKINYISFGILELIKQGKFKERDNRSGDCWVNWLMHEMENIDGNHFDKDEHLRSPIPPYGRQFCSGHPSPRAQEKLAERIYEELKK